MEFLLQHRDGTFLTANILDMWTPFASHARRLNILEARRVSARIPGSRIVDLRFAGSFEAEELRASADFENHLCGNGY